jgi:carbon monoxide dehydrogenase subunit G
LTKIIFHPEPGWYHWERMPRSFTISVGNSLNGPWTQTYSANLPTPNQGLSGTSTPTFDDLGKSTYGRYIRFDFSQPMCYGSPVDGCTHSHGQVTLSEIAMYTGETAVVTATTDATFPITGQGTTVVTWTYDDGNGNTSTQTQDVVINDVTAPVADVATLADLTGQCSVAAPITPTATDNCDGSVTGVASPAFPITTQGTTVVTWTFSDAVGKTSTQTQNVIINDVTAPVADLATLADITAECEVTALTAPTATDNCGGTVTVTNDATLPISTQGTTTVTWTYDDGNGNTSTQTQNVIINDVTAPVADLATLADITAECSVDIGGSPTLVWGPTDVNNNTETISLSSNELYELYINHSDVNSDGFGSIKFTYTDGTVDEFKFWGNGGMRLWDPLTGSYGNIYSVGIHSSAFMSEANTSMQYYVECSSVTGVNTWTFRNLDMGLSSIELTDNASWQGLLGSQISSISSITAPTAADNCEGTITGTTTDPLSYNTQGTHVITWTYMMVMVIHPHRHKM